MSMTKTDLEAMSADDLWSLHQKISGILPGGITSRKRELENHLAFIDRDWDTIEGDDAPSYKANGKAITRRANRRPAITDAYRRATLVGKLFAAWSAKNH
jgi:hypothetical protein